MTDRDPSRTALGTAYMRAAHQLMDGEPRILEDPVAVPLLGPVALRRINDAPDRYRTPEALALRAHVVLRSRFAEDRLASAMPRRIGQYVILGAGFDTFALRQPAWAMSLKIVEVDHAATQGEKRSRIAAAGLVMPGNVDFVDIDFEGESMRDGLARCGLSMNVPTFFSWLGVMMYLKEDAIDAVLRSIAAFPEGSEIVLTFRQAPEQGAGSPSLLADRVASLGEPFVSFFEPHELEAKLGGAGFSKVEFLSPAEAEERYFRQRPKDLPIPHRTSIASAII